MSTATATRTRFTPSQLAVIILAAQGLTNAQISERLDIPVTAVTDRVRQAMVTTGTGTRVGLVAQACRWGQLQDVPAQAAGPVVLTPAQTELLGMLAAGLVYREMAGRLRLRLPGVANRSQGLLRALGATDRAHAVLIAWQLRILPEVGR